MKAISLFSGAGGLDLGLAEVGIETLACVEIDRHCVSTLQRNTTARVLPVDVRSLDPYAVANSVGVSQIDVLHGGPPCQPFSQIGKRNGSEHKDGLLIFEFLRWVRELQPAWFIIEQVKGLLAHRGCPASAGCGSRPGNPRGGVDVATIAELYGHPLGSHESLGNVRLRRNPAQ